MESLVYGMVMVYGLCCRIWKNCLFSEKRESHTLVEIEGGKIGEWVKGNITTS